MIPFGGAVWGGFVSCCLLGSGECFDAGRRTCDAELSSSDSQMDLNASFGGFGS